MINVSHRAQKYLSSLLLKEPLDTHIRVFIINPGTHNAECGIAYCLKNEIEETDIQLQYDQFYIYVNKSLINYLKNSEIDLIIDNLGSHLTVKAPYSRHNFSQCKKHFSNTSLLEKITHFLNTTINPQLSTHGGRVDLIKIDIDGTAVIEFSGGCNGCSMIGMTLKETVEKNLIDSFPEIKKVHDQTKHAYGNHSFY